MSKRVSHSLLDPYLTLPFKRFYPWLPIPRAFPPEGIVLLGHVGALVGAVGLALSVQFGWGGWLACAGVAANHLADIFDGTHARATNQCRNGGELLDHFTDPLSFAYCISGLAVSIDRLDLGLAGVICLFATALLTNIKAKMIGEFSLSTFGPTEFKTLLACYGAGLAMGHVAGWSRDTLAEIAFYFYLGLLSVGMVQLVVNLIHSIREVNARGAPPDTSEWITTRDH